VQDQHRPCQARPQLVEREPVDLLDETVAQLDIEVLILHAETAGLFPAGPFLFGQKREPAVQEVEGRGDENTGHHRGWVMKREPRRRPAAHARAD
jgi:hypothetical protein